MVNHKSSIVNSKSRPMVKNQKRIEQIAGMALIGAIVLGCGFVLRPFVSAILWAAILCFATWPLHELFLKWLPGRRALAGSPHPLPRRRPDVYRQRSFGHRLGRRATTGRRVACAAGVGAAH